MKITFPQTTQSSRQFITIFHHCQSMSNELKSKYLYLHFFTSVPVIGPVTLNRIVAHFGSAAKAYEQIGGNWSALNLNQKILEAIKVQATTFNFQKEEDLLSREKIQLLSINDPDYPLLLKQVHNPPPLLYLKGNKDILNSRMLLAVVGTRTFTAYGKSSCQQLTAELISADCTIVSGLALGIDAIAHETSLANNGRTIAVLGTGIDDRSIYPRANFQLAQRIIQSNGCVISQFPPGTQSLKHNFPMRNRIISGLSKGTLVIEAAEKSGSLITAYAALEQNRDIFAIPGSIFSPASAGTNLLIQKGAKLVMDADDILNEFPESQIKSHQPELTTYNPQITRLNKTEKAIVEALSQPLDLDMLLINTQLLPSQLLSTITVLELKGLIKKVGAEYVRL